jgi:flagellar basal-body rod protein FlgB
MWDKLFQVTDCLQSGLKASSLRNKVIVNNIANVDTPGYKVSEVSFEDVLISAFSSGDLELKTTRPGHLRRMGGAAGEVDPVITVSEDTSYRSDENNVDIEAQMADLSQNSLQYYTLVSKVNSEFTKLNMAITGGR